MEETAQVSRSLRLQPAQLTAISLCLSEAWWGHQVSEPYSLWENECLSTTNWSKFRKAGNHHRNQKLPWNACPLLRALKLTPDIVKPLWIRNGTLARHFRFSHATSDDFWICLITYKTGVFFFEDLSGVRFFLLGHAVYISFGWFIPLKANFILSSWVMECWWCDFCVINPIPTRLFCAPNTGGGGGGGGFRLKPHIEVRFKWMWFPIGIFESPNFSLREGSKKKFDTASSRGLP